MAMSAVRGEPGDFADRIRMRYQCRDGKNRENEFVEEQGDLRRDITLLKDEIRYLKRTNRELLRRDGL